jgi:hypothetical protein
MIGNKLLDVLSFLLVCDVVWMGLLAKHCPVVTFGTASIAREATNVTSVIVRVLEI